MRDIKRIDKFLYKLKEVWRLYPDLRFWQLIAILNYPETLNGQIDLFYIEENQWIDIFEDTIAEYKKKYKETHKEEDK